MITIHYIFQQIEVVCLADLDYKIIIALTLTLLFAVDMLMSKVA